MAGAELWGGGRSSGGERGGALAEGDSVRMRKTTEQILDPERRDETEKKHLDNLFEIEAGAAEFKAMNR